MSTLDQSDYPRVGGFLFQPRGTIRLHLAPSDRQERGDEERQRIIPDHLQRGRQSRRTGDPYTTKKIVSLSSFV